MAKIAFIFALLALSPAAVAWHQGTLVRTGSFQAGDPAGYGLADACTWPELEGQNSNCFTLPGGYGGHRYQVQVGDEAGTIVGTAVCYYTWDYGYSQCDPPNRRIPSWAAHVSVATIGGVNVHWKYVAA